MKGEGAKRILTAVVGIPALASIIYLGSIWFVSVIAVVAALAQYEFYKLEEKRSIEPSIVLGLLTGLAVSFRHVDQRLDPIIGVFLILIVLDGLRKHGDSEPISKITGTIAGLVYPVLFLSLLPLLREQLVDTKFMGYAFEATLLLFVLIWSCDTGAYYTGRTLGKTPLAPNVSPNKTKEGAIGGIVLAFLVAVVIRYTLIPVLSWLDILALSAIAGGLGQAGDLLESAIKRSAGVKDSGSILPGHGGFLDRFDSLILATPAYYLYLIYVSSYL